MYYSAIIVVVAAVVFGLLQSSADEEISDLINELVSTNKAPNPTREPFITYPDGYDHKAQNSVFETSKKLEYSGFAAIPMLIESLDDDRYCYSETSAILSDSSVGDECFNILCRITNPRKKPDIKSLKKESVRPGAKAGVQRLGADDEWHFLYLVYFDLIIPEIDTDKEKLAIVRKRIIEKWWQKFSKLSLDHIHLDAVEKLIMHEEKIGFRSKTEQDSYLKPYKNYAHELKHRIAASAEAGKDVPGTKNITDQ